jgi:mono/diheme cytochrome c family protein
MKNPITRGAILLFMLLYSSAVITNAQEVPKGIKTAPIAVTNAGSGEEMFSTYCAVCHGAVGKGDGPAATEFKIPPANLTTLARRHDGKFPDAYVTQILTTGPRDAKAHGSEDMPVWGVLFKSIGDSGQVKLRIHNLTKYVESLQVK